MRKKLFSIGLSLCLLLPSVGCSTTNTGNSTSGLVAPAASTIRGEVVATREIESVSPDQLKASRLRSLETLTKVVDRQDGIGDDTADGNVLDAIWTLVKDDVGKHVQYFVKSVKISYKTVDAHGREQTVSGVVLVPFSISGRVINAPILSLQHPTQVERRYSPSLRNLQDNEFTYQGAMLVASSGYIVVAADYPGLGDNHDTHPYCHTSLANCVTDLVEATIHSGLLAANKATWNNQLFLLGYSEGAYATMVAARQFGQQGKYSVAAAACGDGPYSLSESMRNVILFAGPQYTSPYFLPYFIAAYDSAYGDKIPSFHFKRAIVSNLANFKAPVGSSYPQELSNLLDGSHSDLQINDFMRLVQPYLGPRSILSPEMLVQIATQSSPEVKAIKDNDAFRDWSPNFPLKMFHNTLDDLVPVENTRIAAQAFTAGGPWSSEEFLTFVPDLGSIHAGSLPIAYLKSFNFIDAIAYPERHK